MKFNWKILAVIALALGLVVGVPVAAHYRAKGELESYRKQLTARGEKLALEEIAPPPKAGERTAALDFMQAVRALGSYLTNSPPMMHKLAPGRALVASAEKSLPTSESSNIWPELSPLLLARGEAFASLRTALQTPAMDFGLDFTQGYSLLLPHLAPAKSTALWLAAATLNELHAGHLTNALADLNSLVAMSHPLEHEPLMISQLVRIAIEQIAMSATWEALQTPGWRDEDLAQLQNAWNSLDPLEGIELASQMERAFTPLEFAVGRKSFNAAGAAFGGVYSGNSSSAPDTLAQALANPKDGMEAFSAYQRYWMWKWQWSYEEELYNAQAWQAGLETGRAMRNHVPIVPEFQKLEDHLATLRDAHPGAENRFLFGFNDGLIDKFLTKFADIQMEQRLVVTAIALKRYQLRQGKYPARLQDLTPGYLSEIPLDPMDGKPLRYQPKPGDTFLLYSVGEDGEDNGGDPSPQPPEAVTKFSWFSESPNPIWLKARDAVWPMPATAEEVQAYKDKSLADWSQSRGHRRMVPPPLPLPAETNAPAANKN